MERKEDAIIRVYEVLKDNNVPPKAAHQVVSTILDNGFKIEDSRVRPRPVATNEGSNSSGRV